MWIRLNIEYFAHMCSGVVLARLLAFDPVESRMADRGSNVGSLWA